MSLAEGTGREISTIEKVDARRVDRYLKKLDAAAALVGELVRNGKTVFYINLRPFSKGKTMEGTHHELVEFLIRNRYV
jgi:hypothetical protein